MMKKFFYKSYIFGLNINYQKKYKSQKEKIEEKETNNENQKNTNQENIGIANQSNQDILLDNIILIQGIVKKNIKLQQQHPITSIQHS